LAIAYNLPDAPRLQRSAEFRHALGAVVAPAHPLANLKTVRMSDCLLYPLVLADRPGRAQPSTQHSSGRRP
ncbi:LysR substrate-binding domain-containing protein, partial [Rhizobium johnstonii]